MINFTTEQEAARAILGEAALTLDRMGIDYVVLGGWIPLLFHSKHLPHPGSFDVDVLINPNTTRDQFNDSVLSEFKKLGYMLPAKNKFQLFKPLQVNDEPILFHIDLLHTNYAPYQDKDDMYINWGKMQSINGPGTDLIFTEFERFSRELEIVLPSGETQNVNVKFASELGFLSAKGRALISPKRKRDSYDIYMIITQSMDFNYLLTKSHEFYHNNRIFKKSIDTIHGYFFSEKKQGVKNVKKYMMLYKDEIKIPEDSMESVIEERIGSFLTKVMTK
jgi:hypothetical protein